MAISETAIDRLTAQAGVAVAAVTKRFGETDVLLGSDLSVAAGSVLTLLGPSGCGKTTLLRIIAGLERPDGGSVTVGERVVVAPPATFVPPEERRIGMVFQEAALFPHLTVAGNVGYGLPRRERASSRVADALALVGLEKVAGRGPSQLSGGQQQRVALARALVTEPQVILLDEPFASLDAPLRSQLRMEVKRVLREIRATAIFVTHDQEEAFLIGDQVAVMVDGRILQQDTPSEVYERPASWQVAAFLGDANFLPGRASGRVAETLIGRVPLHEERRGSVAVMVRPEWIEVDAGPGPQVEAVEFYGHDSIYVLRADDGARVRVRVMGAPRHPVGDRVTCRFCGPAATVFGGGTRPLIEPNGSRL